MSLIGYTVEYKALSAEDRSCLLKAINNYSSTGAHIHKDFCSCDFFINDYEDVSMIPIPDGAHLTRL